MYIIELFFKLKEKIKNQKADKMSLISVSAENENENETNTDIDTEIEQTPISEE